MTMEITGGVEEAARASRSTSIRLGELLHAVRGHERLIHANHLGAASQKRHPDDQRKEQETTRDRNPQQSADAKPLWYVEDHMPRHGQQRFDDGDSPQPMRGASRAQASEQPHLVAESTVQPPHPPT